MSYSPWLGAPSQHHRRHLGLHLFQLAEPGHHLLSKLAEHTAVGRRLQVCPLFLAQCEVDRGAFADRSFGPDAAGVPGHNALDGGQADPGTLELGRIV